MGLFRRAGVKADPAELERWRGRSAEIEDAGPLPWAVVFAALKVAPEPGPDAELDLPALMMAPLGLDWLEVHDRGTAGGGFDGESITTPETNIYHGTRYGRPVLLNHGSQRSGQKGAMVCWVSASTPDLSLTGRAGRLVPEGAVPVEVGSFLAGLSEQRALWKDVHLVGGPGGLVVKRPMTATMHPQGWVYDLWLAEQLAHLTEYATLPAPDPRSTSLPYRLDRTHTW